MVEIARAGRVLCAASSGFADGRSISMPNFKGEFLIDISSFGGSTEVLDCNAVTAEIGIDTEESLEARCAWGYGPEITSREVGDSFWDDNEDDDDFLEKSSCNDGFFFAGLGCVAAVFKGLGS